MTRARSILLTAALAACAFACASGRGSEYEFNEAMAVKVEVNDDLMLIDGVPATLDTLAAALDGAYALRRETGRKSALVLIRYNPKPNENVVEFERRKQRRTQDVLEGLREAGVRIIHLGPVTADGQRPTPPKTP